MTARNKPKTRKVALVVSLFLLLLVLGGGAWLWSRVGPRLLDRLADAKRGKVKADIYSIDVAIQQYMIRNGGRSPDTLSQLLRPDEQGKRLLDREELPLDPWGNEYIYKRPIDTDYLITSHGADGVPGGTGADADYTNRDLKSGR